MLHLVWKASACYESFWAGPPAWKPGIGVRRLSVSPFMIKVEHSSLQRLTNMQRSVELHVEYDKSPHCLQIA